MDTSLPRIETIARQTLSSLPHPFRDLAAGIALQVAELPDPDMLEGLGISDPLDLTGLYDGVPLTEKSPSHPDPFPDVIWLFQKPILAELEERPETTLEELVAHIMIHELAHHFGWSDNDIAQVDRWWE